MSILKSLLFTVCTAVLFLAGCAETQRYATVEQICVANTSKAEAIQAAEAVLGEMHFSVEKADAEQGFIRSRPLQGAQFFEFWRRDNVGDFNRAEANLHSIRRTVELDISEVSSQQGGQLCIECNVNVQRLNLSERQDSGSLKAYEMFSTSRSSVQRIKTHPEQDMSWADLGRDARLETEILEQIENKIAQQQKEKRQ